MTDPLIASADPHVDSPGLPDALKRYTGFLLNKVGMIAQKQFSARLESLGLTTRMWGALNVLDAAGAITQHALCKGTGMDPSTMVSTIDELEAQGLVERRPHPSDRRAHALHITDPGRETLARGRRIARQAQEDLLAPLNEEEREQLRSLLLRLAVANSGAGKPDLAHGAKAAPADAGTAPAGV
jgi:DNA-binding MarR family transcriptional regulator